MTLNTRLSAMVPPRFRLSAIGIALWLLASLLLIISCRAIIRDLSGWDPDDQLRLVQLRDFLAGQSWFDTTQYRMNPPDGAPMHWSRLIELPLALIVTLCAPILGTARAEMLAGTIVPLLCLGAIAFMASAIAKRFAGNFAAIVAMILTFLAPAVLIQMRPMRIDHHGWQAVMAMLGLWTLFWPSRKWGGVVLGLALATWLHISMEGVPISGAFFLYLGWRWIVGQDEGTSLYWTLLSFAAVSLLLFFGTQPLGVFAANHCDTISPMHIGAIMLGSAIMLGAIHFNIAQRWPRLAAAALAGVAVIGCLLLIAPACAGGAFAGLDPLVRDYWYVNVSEGLPIWRQDSEAAWTLIAGALAGAIALLSVARRDGDPEWRTLDFFVIAATLLSFFVFRTVTVAAAFAVIPVAIWIAQLAERWRKSEAPVQRMGFVLLILALAIPGAIVGPLVGKLTAKPETVVAAKDSGQSEKCESVDSVRKLSLLPDSNLIAPFDMGPAILMTTRHSVLASSHHRNTMGMRDQIEIFRSAPDKSRELMKKHGITRIAVCVDEAEMGLYAEKDPKGLWAQLAATKVPDWLEYEGIYGAGIAVWRVKDAENP
jgi:hypothetical protein